MKLCILLYCWACSAATSAHNRLGPLLAAQASFTVADGGAALKVECAKACDMLRRLTGEEGEGAAIKAANKILPYDCLATCRVRAT